MRQLHVLLVAAVVSACESPVTPRDVGADQPVQITAAEGPCAGTPESRGDALRTTIESASDGETIRLGACEYFVRDSLRGDHAYWGPDSLYNSGILIEGKTGLSIVGAGAGETVVKFGRRVYIGFEVRSNTRNLTISDMTIEGSIYAPLCDDSPEYPDCVGSRLSDKPGTHGIGSTARATGIRDIRMQRLEVRNVAVALSVGTWGKCDYLGAVIEDNYIYAPRGKYSGTGYGIHVDCGGGFLIRNNVIVQPGRHAIYVGRTSHPNPDPIVITNNMVVDHGHYELKDFRVSAIAIARSDNVAVVDNTLVGGHAYGITAEYEYQDCTRCLLAGNKFVNVGDIEDIWINAQSTVWMWRNVRDQNQPATVKDDTGMGVDIGAVGSTWEGTQAVAVMTDEDPSADLVYAMKNDVLYAVRPEYGASPDTWLDFRHSTRPFQGFFGMTASDGLVYVLRDDEMSIVTPEWFDGDWATRSSAGWGAAGAMAARSDGYLYLIAGGALRRVDPLSWTQDQLRVISEAPYALGLGNDKVYAKSGDTVFQIDLRTSSTLMVN